MAGTYDLVIYQGADWDVLLTWTAGSPLAPVNLTGWSAHAQIRSTWADNSGGIYADISSSGGGIVLGGTAGTIELILSAAATAALSFDTGVYDLKMTSPTGKITRLVMGQARLSRQVTV